MARSGRGLEWACRVGRQAARPPPGALWLGGTQRQGDLQLQPGASPRTQVREIDEHTRSDRLGVEMKARGGRARPSVRNARGLGLHKSVGTGPRDALPERESAARREEAAAQHQARGN